MCLLSTAGGGYKPRDNLADFFGRIPLSGRKSAKNRLSAGSKKDLASFSGGVRCVWRGFTLPDLLRRQSEELPRFKIMDVKRVQYFPSEILSRGGETLMKAEHALCGLSS